MKPKREPSESTPLWQLAEDDVQADLEPVEPPLLAEFTQLNELISTHPKVIEHREMNGDKVELTPSVRYITLVDRPQLGSTSADQGRSTTLLPDTANITGSMVAQAHRLEGQRELSLRWHRET